MSFIECSQFMEGVGHHLQSQEQQLCLEENTVYTHTHNGVCVCVVW